MNAPQSYPLPEKIVLDGSDEALAVILALDQLVTNTKRRKAQKAQAA